MSHDNHQRILKLYCTCRTESHETDSCDDYGRYANLAFSLLVNYTLHNTDLETQKLYQVREYPTRNDYVSCWTFRTNYSVPLRSGEVRYSRGSVYVRLYNIDASTCVSFLIFHSYFSPFKRNWASVEGTRPLL